ncbi:atrial natriuretic peptide receptor 1-like [Paramacrobiotus metropolitanus]|uniref:atrial natriuretic peptide receptor 1-like n=1 Tax=Paramacrobiotus metropolitanus TaxID=2943436 RepID=UPI00244589D8|nr:atrial natriuretic peptide receptor 1-like [Paramacrobiotus metropolitanus]
MSQWNMLWISTQSTSRQIRDRQANPSWIAVTHFAPSQCSEFYIDLFKRYNWTTIFVLIDKGSPPVYPIIASNLLDDLKQNRIVTPIVREIPTKPGASFGQFGPILEDIRKISRVVLFFGHNAFLREFLITAANMGMTNGEYVYIVVESMRNKILGRLNWKYDDANDEKALQAFQSLLIVHQKNVDMGTDLRLGPEFIRRSFLDYNFTYSLQDQPFLPIVDSYLAFPTIATVLNDSIREGHIRDLGDGRALARRFLNRTFTNEYGTFYIDENGQRRTDFVVSYFLSSGVRERLVARDGMTRSWIEITQLDHWGNSSTASFPPLSEPICGYLHQKPACLQKYGSNQTYIIGFTIAGVVLLVFTVIICCVRSAKRKAHGQLIHNTWWQLTLDSISHPSALRTLYSSVFAEAKAEHYDGVAYDDNDVHISGFRALHKGIGVIGYPVAIIKHATTTITFGELGSNRELSSMLKMGVEAVHNSAFGYHGRLSVFNCWIDKHFTLKLMHLASDRLFPTIQAAGASKLTNCPWPFSATWEEHFWSPPELFQDATLPVGRRQTKSMQAVDIFSTGLILYDILTRSSLCKKMGDISHNKKGYHQNEPTENPLVNAIDYAEVEPLAAIIRACVDRDPTGRPTIGQLRARLAIVSPSLAPGMRRFKLFDKIQQRLAAYADQLEWEVETRTKLLHEEMVKCDTLISQILPREIVSRLRVGLAVAPEVFNSVTLSFTDLYGFVEFVSAEPPEVTISLIGKVEDFFDRLCTQCDIYKVEAVGDMFLAASGLPQRNGDSHVRYICAFALKVMQTGSALSLPEKLCFRIGIHTGPCAAGIMGTKRPRYCLFGDTINVASRMCSQGLPGRIHLSVDTHQLLGKNHHFVVETRGLLAVKGKNDMMTFWLTAWSHNVEGKEENLSKGRDAKGNR